MKTIEVTLYKFDELSEEAKKKAIEDNRGILTDFGTNWWEVTFEHFRDLGIEIDGFDLYSYKLSFDLTEDVDQVCKNIINEMGYEWAEMAQNFLDSVDAQLALDLVDQDMLQDMLLDMESLFLKDLRCEILGWLDDEFEYLNSDKAIRAYLYENEFDFTINGEIQ